jgi:CRISPR system Cascade subunit CasD
MQSWGVQSRFGVRDTGREPSKSGVIGLLCAALGRPRSAPLDDLTSLCMGVRVDREGRMAVDYHTAQNVYKAGGGIKDTELSRRYYLTDAAFLVGLEGEIGLLAELQAALRAPRWPLCLGRKAFVPGEPVWLPDGLREQENLESALKTYPWLGRGEEPPEKLRLVLDQEDGFQVRPDVPLSFAERRFSSRRVVTLFYRPPPPQREVT